MKRPTFDDFNKEVMEKPDLKAEYDRLKPTYEITSLNASIGIKCLKCNKTSYDCDDVFHYYCANCKLWHLDALYEM